MKSNNAGLQSFSTQRSTSRSKIITVPEVATIAKGLRARNVAVVQAHGTFDLLHLGHVRHLEAAKALGDVLVVTLTADRFVNKGPGARYSRKSCARRCWRRWHLSTMSPSPIPPTP